MRQLNNLLVGISFIALALSIGCSAQTTDTAVTPPVDVNTTDEAVEELTVDVSVGSEIALTPDNTLIQFVGTHVGPKPDPKARTGKFNEFAGKAIVEDDELKSVSVEIQMASVDTGMDKLNNHLQNEDFFSVREYPTAKFESTKIARDEDGDHILTGNLTLHSKTNEVTFPATVGMTDGNLSLKGKMTLDRSSFGMDKMTDKVDKEVELMIAIGDSAG